MRGEAPDRVQRNKSAISRIISTARLGADVRLRAAGDGVSAANGVAGSRARCAVRSPEWQPAIATRLRRQAALAA